MKKELMNDRCEVSYLKSRFLLMVFLMMSVSVFSQIEKTKTFEKSYEVQKGAWIKIVHRDGAIRIKRSRSNKVITQLDVMVTGKYKEDVEALLQEIELEQSTNGRSQVEILTVTNTENWVKVNGKSTVQLKNGNQLKGIEELHMDLEIAIPDGVNLQVSNKFGDITLRKIKANIEIQNYNGEVNAEDIDGDFSLNLKYGKAKIGKVHDADLTLYESTINISSIQKLKLNAKYSKNTFVKITKGGEVQSYECTFDIAAIYEEIDIKDKYSDWSVGLIDKGKITTYETHFNIGSIQNAFISSKESDYNIGSAGEIFMDKTYEDDINLGQLGLFKCDNSRYLDLNIAMLTTGIYLYEDYNGDVEINNVGSGFEGAEINGKNTDVELPLENLPYQIDVAIKNGDVSLDEDKLKSGFYSEDDYNVKINGKMNGAKKSSPKVVLKGKNMDVQLD